MKRLAIFVAFIGFVFSAIICYDRNFILETLVTSIGALSTFLGLMIDLGRTRRQSIKIDGDNNRVVQINGLQGDISQDSSVIGNDNIHLQINEES